MRNTYVCENTSSVMRLGGIDNVINVCETAYIELHGNTWHIYYNCQYEKQQLKRRAVITSEF